MREQGWKWNRNPGNFSPMFFYLLSLTRWLHNVKFSLIRKKKHNLSCCRGGAIIDEDGLGVLGSSEILSSGCGSSPWVFFARSRSSNLFFQEKHCFQWKNWGIFFQQMQNETIQEYEILLWQKCKSIMFIVRIVELVSVSLELIQ